MKKIILATLIFVFQYNLYAQICDYSQTFTIKTPKGQNIIANEWGGAGYYGVSQYIISTYAIPNYPVVDPNGNQAYNCHGYGWHTTGYDSNTYRNIRTAWNSNSLDSIAWIDDNICSNYYAYMDDGSYYKYDYANLPHIANLKVFYARGTIWEHTAITTDDPNIYRSKFGDGPLIYHTKDYHYWSSYTILGYNMRYRIVEN